MRRFAPALTLFLAACATAPQKPAAPSTIVTPSPQRQSGLLGLTSSELVQRFGNPALQVREGPGMKLQFRRRGCVLDAYLYAPPTGGVERVAHVDSRYPTGADANPQSCIAALEGP
jgi:hypothetical protein